MTNGLMRCSLLG